MIEFLSWTWPFFAAVVLGLLAVAVNDRVERWLLRRGPR